MEKYFSAILFFRNLWRKLLLVAPHVFPFKEAVEAVELGVARQFAVARFHLYSTLKNLRRWTELLLF